MADQNIEIQKAEDKKREKALFDSAYKKVGEKYKYAILPIPGNKRYGGRGSNIYQTLYTPYLLASAVVLMAQEDHHHNDATYDSETVWVEIGNHIICEVTIISTLYGKHKGSKRVNMQEENIDRAFEVAQTGAMVRALNFAGGYGLFAGEELIDEENNHTESESNNSQTAATTETLNQVTDALMACGIPKTDVGPFMMVTIQSSPFNGNIYEKQAQAWLKSVEGKSIIPPKSFDQFTRFLCKTNNKDISIVQDFINSAYDGIELRDLEGHQQQELISFIKEKDNA